MRYTPVVMRYRPPVARWSICPALQKGQPGWRLRGYEPLKEPVIGGTGVPVVLLWFADHAEAQEMRGYLKAGLTVAASRAKFEQRIEEECGALRGTPDTSAEDSAVRTWR